MVNPIDIAPSDHARMQMQRRRIAFEDIALVLQYGEHVDGLEEGTREARIELGGRPLTVVYDLARYEADGFFYVITVLRRRCQE